MLVTMKIRINDPFSMLLLGPGVLRHQDRKAGAPKGVENPLTRVIHQTTCIHTAADGSLCKEPSSAKQNGWLCPEHEKEVFRGKERKMNSPRREAPRA